MWLNVYPTIVRTQMDNSCFYEIAMWGSIKETNGPRIPELVIKIIMMRLLTSKNMKINLKES